MELDKALNIDSDSGKYGTFSAFNPRPLAEPRTQRWFKEKAEWVESRKTLIYSPYAAAVDYVHTMDQRYGIV